MNERINLRSFYFLDIIKNNDFRSTQKYILSGQDVNVTNETKQNGLHLSCENGNLKIAMLLIENKINANLLDDNGYSPIQMAVKNNHKEIIDNLRTLVDLGTRDKYVNTIYHK